MKKFIQTLSEAVLIVDSDGYITALNETSAGLLKKDEKDCIGVKYLDLLTLKSQPSFMEKAKLRNEVPDLFNIDDRFFEMEEISKVKNDNAEDCALYRLKDVTVSYQTKRCWSLSVMRLLWDYSKY